MMILQKGWQTVLLDLSASGGWPASRVFEVVRLRNWQEEMGLTKPLQKAIHNQNFNRIFVHRRNSKV